MNAFLHWILVGGLGFLSLSVFSQTYPTKPIRFVVPFSAGGTADILAREVGQRLSVALGQQVVVDNRPGAGGNIAAEISAKAAPDGHTIFLGSVGTQSINVSLYKKLPFDPVKDFIPITLVATTPNLLVVHPSVPAKSVKELIALAKSKPQELTFASGGNGTSHHLCGELFKSVTGVEMMHVPYKGSGQAMPDLLGGQVSLMFDNMPTALPHVKSGKLRALAVTSSKRSSALPDVPTMAEAGVSGVESYAWWGVLVPAKTPAAIVSRLNSEIVKILRSPEIKTKFAAQGTEPVPQTSEQFAAYSKAETEKWAKVVKASGAQVD